MSRKSHYKHQVGGAYGRTSYLGGQKRIIPASVPAGATKAAIRLERELYGAPVKIAGLEQLESQLRAAQEIAKKNPMLEKRAADLKKRIRLLLEKELAKARNENFSLPYPHPKRIIAGKAIELISKKLARIREEKVRGAVPKILRRLS